VKQQIGQFCNKAYANRNRIGLRALNKLIGFRSRIGANQLHKAHTPLLGRTEAESDPHCTSRALSTYSDSL
jgi:hypothetical protein